MAPITAKMKRGPTHPRGGLVERQRLGIQDSLWLEMDRRNNLMVADVVVWTASPVHLGRLRALLIERFVERYPVFSSTAVRDSDGSWWWQTSENFAIESHFVTAALENPDDPEALQRLMSTYRMQALDRSRPLWQVVVVERYLEGSAMIFRSHHCIADGMRMVQLAMSLFDAAPEGGAILAPPARTGGSRSEAKAGPRARRSPATSTGARLRSAPLGRYARLNPLGAAHTLLGRSRRARSWLRDALAPALGALDAVRKFLLGTRNDVTLWTGTAGAQKGIAWSEPLALPRVKSVAKAHQCTVNDVLVATVACTLHDYLEARQAHCSSVTFMVPVNIKPLDLTLPDTLGNEFALVQLELPTDESDPLHVVRIAKRRMDRIKRGNEAAIAFRLQEAIAGFSGGLYRAAVNLFTNRTLGVLTNVPGPPIPVYLAGSFVQSIVGWAPVAGNQPMSFSICSYNGTVAVGIACDTALVPNYQGIVGGFAAAFERIAAATPGIGPLTAQVNVR